MPGCYYGHSTSRVERRLVVGRPKRDRSVNRRAKRSRARNR